MVNISCNSYLSMHTSKIFQALMGLRKFSDMYAQLCSSQTGELLHKLMCQGLSISCTQLLLQNGPCNEHAMQSLLSAQCGSGYVIDVL